MYTVEPSLYALVARSNDYAGTTRRSGCAVKNSRHQSGLSAHVPSLTARYVTPLVEPSNGLLWTLAQQAEREAVNF